MCWGCPRQYFLDTFGPFSGFCTEGAGCDVQLLHTNGTESFCGTRRQNHSHWLGISLNLYFQRTQVFEVCGPT